MKDLKVGIIGGGLVAKMHRDAIARIPGVTLTAVCDLSAAAAEKFAAEVGKDCQSFTDVQQMVETAGVDVAIVCTPHMAHAAASIPCLKAGIPTLIEKPLAATLEQCDLILAAAKEGNTQVGVVCQRRGLPPVERVYGAIRDGVIGQPVLVTAQMNSWRSEAYYQMAPVGGTPWRGTWKGEGGALMVNQGPHHMDMVLSIMGPIAQVSAMVGNVNHPTIEAEDVASISIRFKSGALGNIMFTNSMDPGFYAGFSVTDGKGRNIGVKTDGVMFVAGAGGMPNPPIIEHWNVGDGKKAEELAQVDGEFFHGLESEYGAGWSTTYFHMKALEDFFSAVRENRAPRVGADIGRQVVELMTAAYRSAVTGKAVDFPVEVLSDEDEFAIRRQIHRIC